MERKFSAEVLPFLKLHYYTENLETVYIVRGYVDRFSESGVVP